ncbi:MAG: cytochrome-c peroxidase [Azospira oryzae]|jgi:cytochrome c peroxidase|nr:MAG: cytochrome-c peroxidase [Azospira oryzae]
MFRDSTNLFRIQVALLVLLLSITFFSFQKNHSTPEPYVLNYPAYFGNRFTIPADNPTTKEGVYLGRKLFYEPRLSRGNQFSCANCHLQQRAFADETSLSMGIGGLTSRNSMSLANLLWVRHFFWDGRAASLEAQAVIPLTDQREMGQSLAESVLKLKKDSEYVQLFDKAFGSSGITEAGIVKAIAQFERTLISSNSPYDHYLKGEYQPTEQELRGLKLFMTSPSPSKNIRGANCAQCHGTPRTQIELFHNNGLDSVFKDKGRMAFTGQEIDRGRFRVPTLRNIAVTAPYMHDGRFKTLEEVVDHYNEHIVPSATLSTFISDATNAPGGKSLLLTAQEKNDLVSFLHLLTDSTFMTNPEFSDPRLQSKRP